MYKYPNLITIPEIHIKTEDVIPVLQVVLANLSCKSIFLENDESSGSLDKADVHICKITTNTASEPLTFKATQEQFESEQQQEEGKFICSAAVISICRKLHLYDTEVSKDIQKIL